MLIFLETQRHFQVSTKSKMLILFIAEKGKTHILLRKTKKRTPRDLLIDQEEISQKLYEKNLILSTELKVLQEKVEKYENEMM